MSEDEDRGRWEGAVETVQKALVKRVDRLEYGVVSILTALAVLGLKSMGLF